MGGLDPISASSSTTKTSNIQNLNSAKQNKKGTVIIVKKDGKFTEAQKVACKSLQNQVNQGHVEYVDVNLLENITNWVIDGKSGDHIRLSNFADPNKYKNLTFGEAKQLLKLNLPAGSLKNNKIEQGGGNFDNYHVPMSNGQYYLDVFVDDLKEGTGMTEEQIQKMCHKK